jgi:DNA-binding transcriptional ArsR family regulator
MQNGLGTPTDEQRVALARDQILSPDDAARLTRLLQLLADPVRVRILYALNLVEELCVGDIARTLDASEDAVGYGLRMLRTAGLVQTRKVGRAVFYRLAGTFPEPLLEHCLRELIHLSELAAGQGPPAPAPPPYRSLLRRRHR